jgi:uncharacterized protein (DUF1786 family)
MSKYLMIDIGAGTMDVLYYDSVPGIHYKAVSMSPVLYMAEKVTLLEGDLLITGCEMGGGAISSALKERAEETDVIMSAPSAATINHSMEKVRLSGIKVIEEAEAEELKNNECFSHLEIGDLDIERLRQIVKGMGVHFSFDTVGICAQDHGMPPEGVSHLDYRHNIFKAHLDNSPFSHSMLYNGDEVPDTLNRLSAIAESAKNLPASEVFVMDSGMAAILGASLDSESIGLRRIMVMDVATSHTVGAALENGEISGFFEYHTRDISLEKLESLLVDLSNGELSHEKILEEGGHGAYIRKAFGFRNCEMIVVTGPKRSLVKKSRLNLRLGAPIGDNMMTGTAGLLEAIRRRKGLEPFSYVL